MVQEDTLSNINTDTSLKVMYYLRNAIHPYTLESRNSIRKEEKRTKILTSTRRHINQTIFKHLKCRAFSEFQVAQVNGQKEKQIMHGKKVVKTFS